MALRTSEAPEADTNPINEHYKKEVLTPDGLSEVERGRLGGYYAKNQDEIDEQKRGLRQSEQAAGEAIATASEGDIREKEQEGWRTNYDANSLTPRQAKLQGFVKSKKGPGAVIIALLFVAGFGMSSLLGPSLLLVHMSEIITGRLNSQVTSMTERTTKILINQMSSRGTNGACTIVKLRCRYNTMPERIKNRFEEAGIKVNVAEDKTLLGRYKVTSLEFNGDTINASNFKAKMITDSTFREAVQKGYNPKFAGFADKVWQKVAGWLGVSKKATFGENVKDDEERTKILEEETKNGRSAGDIAEGEYVQKEIKDKNGNGTGENGWFDKDGNLVRDTNGNLITDAAAEAHNASLGTLADIETGADSVVTNGEKTATKVLADAEAAVESATADGTFSKANRLLGLAALPDFACTAYGAVQALAHGAKEIRAVQMARYAMAFHNGASMIKAGTAKPEDIAYLANILTKTVNIQATDANGNTVTTTTKAATDSFGYRWAAYGDLGRLTGSASQYLAGGGLGGKMSGVLDAIVSKLPGSREDINKTCGIITNPFVQGTSFIAGVALMLVPGANIAIGLKDVAQGVALASLTAAMYVLPSMLKDLVAGILVDNNTFGEQAGDAIVSGSGSLLSTVAGGGGNAPLKPEQAVAYTGLQNQVLAQYAEQDRLAYGPLDPRSPNTFMGRIVTQLLPYSAQMSSLSNVFTTTASVVARSLSSIVTPSTFAAATVSDFTICQDYDYREIGLATDPFCNPIRGIPPQYLDIDPEEVATSLIDNGTIDEVTGQPRGDTENGKNYSEFIANCIDRRRPLGDAGQNFNEDDGSHCFIDDKDSGKGVGEKMKAYYYLNYIDQRVLDGLENGYTLDEGCAPSTGSSVAAGGAKMAESELKTLIASYGLPAPTADGATGYTKLMNHLAENPDATWAAKSMLAGEKNFKAKGGNVKEYLNTAWLWFETGPDGSSWPDPYEITCQDNADLSHVSLLCNSSNFQIAGYQAENRRGDYINEYRKFYSDEELPSVLKRVVQNSSKAASDTWDYNNPAQNTGLVAKYLPEIDSATINDISPKKDFFDEKAQFLTLILGKDPNIAAALNSYAVSDDDLIPALKGSGYGYITEAKKQVISNMMMALYMIDNGSVDTSGCVTVASGGQAAGKGIAAIFNGKIPDITQEFGPTDYSKGNPIYAYQSEYGIPASQYGHTGVDYGVELDTKLYSPVDGEVVTAGGTCFFKSTDRVVTDPTCDDGTRSQPGTGELKIKITSGDHKGDEVIIGHMHKIDVKVGDHVTVGQYVGLSGTENAPHVHVEYRKVDSSTNSGLRIIDPRTVL